MPPGLHSPGAAHWALGHRRDTAPTTAPLSRRREGARCACQSAPCEHRPYVRSFAPKWPVTAVCPSRSWEIRRIYWGALFPLQARLGLYRRYL